MKNSHTPGPWFLIPDASFEPKCIGRNAAYDPLPIARVGIVARMATPESEAEAQANAVLIANAPALLAMLKYVVLNMDVSDLEGNRAKLKAKARAAIAKAEGTA